MLTLTFGEGGRPEASGAREVTTWRDEDGRICARGFVGARRRWLECPGLGVFSFDAMSTVVHAWPATGVSREHLADRFMRTLQPAILQAMGWQALHASAVAGADGVIALCGISGSGKSTLGFALGRSGYRQIADDGVAVRVGRDGVFAHALPFAPRLRDTAANYFLEPTPSAIRPGGGAPLPLRIILVLEQHRGGSAIDIEPLRPAAAFAVLVSHAHCFEVGDSPDGRRFVEDYLQIAGSVQVCAIRYHPSFSRLDAVLEALTRAASTAGAAPLRPLAPALP